MWARKRFAQHFLEPAWVRKLVEAMAPLATDAFIEIGPGRGALTAVLAQRVQHLVAIELDRDLVVELRAEAAPNVTVVEGDVLRVDLKSHAEALARSAGRVRIVGNLPYNISSPILRYLVQLARDGAPVTDATVMLQDEVARRVCGRPGSGDWGPLAIGVQLRADVRPVLALPPGAFRPAPRVQSAVVQMRFRPPTVGPIDERLLDSLLRAVFGQRRKTLLNALWPFATSHAKDPEAILGQAGIDPRRRPETLTLDEFAQVLRAFERA